MKFVDKYVNSPNNPTMQCKMQQFICS